MHLRYALLRFFILAVLLNLFLLPGLAQQGWHNPAAGGDNAQSASLYQKALQSFQNNDYIACIDLLQKAINIDQNNKNLFHLCALAMSESGDTYNAMLMFQSALTCDYNFIECRNNYGVFLHKIGKIDEAKQAFNECIKIDAKYPEAHYHLAQILKEQGDLDQAIEEFQTTTTLNPKYVDAQKDLGLAMFEKATAGVNEIGEAEEKLRIAANLAPDNPLIHYYLGNIYCADCRLDDAEVELRKALSCDSKLAAAHFELGRLRYYRGDLDRCILEMQAALKVNPVYSDSKKYPKIDIAQAQEYLAKSFEYKSQLAQAVESWKQVAALAKDGTSTFQHMNELVKQLRAQAHKKTKIDYDPIEVQAILDKGIIQSEDGNLAESKLSFERVTKLNPNNFEAHQFLGLLLEAQGDLTGALTEYKTAMSLSPKFDGLYYNMAYLLEKLGLPAEAGLIYQRFHEIAGRYPYDPRHIIKLQQEDARQRQKLEQIKKRGY